MLVYIDIFGSLYHGTDIFSGFSILKTGIKLPLTSRWISNGQSVPLEHGIRFYTTIDIEAAMQFAAKGMIIKFEAPFPKGSVGIVNPGPGGGHVQISFPRESLHELYKRITKFSVNNGKTWVKVDTVPISAPG